MNFQRARGILLIVGTGFAVATLTAAAQTTAPAKSPSFEVASIRQNMNPNPGWRLRFSPDGIDATDVTLQYAIREAYAVYDDRLWSGGPAWLNERRFDIEAKFDVSEFPNPTIEQRRAMLQKLLADRFKLVVHHETKDLPIYELVVAKKGPKLTESKPEEIHLSGLTGKPVCSIAQTSRAGGIELRGCSTKNLADTLTHFPVIGRTVLDKTGLTGLYTIELYWRREIPSASASASPDLSLPSIFTALKEQLGLELKPTKGPLDTIVIDHVEMPTAN